MSVVFYTNREMGKLKQQCRRDINRDHRRTRAIRKDRKYLQHTRDLLAAVQVAAAEQSRPFSSYTEPRLVIEPIPPMPILEALPKDEVALMKEANEHDVLLAYGYQSDHSYDVEYESIMTGWLMSMEPEEFPRRATSGYTYPESYEELLANSYPQPGASNEDDDNPPHRSIITMSEVLATRPITDDEVLFAD